MTYAFGQFEAYIMLGRMSKNIKKKPAAQLSISKSFRNPRDLFSI